MFNDSEGAAPALVPGGDMFNAAAPRESIGANSFTTVDDDGVAGGFFECVFVSWGLCWRGQAHQQTHVCVCVCVCVCV